MAGDSSSPFWFPVLPAYAAPLATARLVLLATIHSRLAFRRNSMTSTMMANGKLRKSLAEEIDRLHSILDGLSEALNEAVATAVKEAVGVAVKEAVQQTLQAVIAEVLTNTELLQTVRGLVAPQLQPEPRQTQGSAEPQKRWFQTLFAKAAVWVTGCYGRVGLVGVAVIGKMGQWAGKLKDSAVGALQKLRSCWRAC